MKCISVISLVIFQSATIITMYWADKYAFSARNPYYYMPAALGIVFSISLLIFIESFISFGSIYGTSDYLNRNGEMCYDLNNNGKCDKRTEDLNGDGVCDVLDCLLYQLSRTNYLFVNSISGENTTTPVVFKGEGSLYTSDGEISNPVGDLLIEPDPSNLTIEFLSPVRTNMINTTDYNDTNANFMHSLGVIKSGIKFGTSSSSLFDTYSSIGNTTIITYGPWLTGQNATTYYLSHIRGNKAIIMLNGFQYECDPANTNSSIVSYSPVPYLPMYTATMLVSVKTVKTASGNTTNYFTNARLSVDTQGHLSINTLDNSVFPCPSGTSSTTMGIGTYCISYVSSGN